LIIILNVLLFALIKVNFLQGRQQLMKQSKNTLAQLLHRGAVKEIAQKLGISSPAVSAAIKSERPGHPAVTEAIRLVTESGALAAAQQLAKLTPIAQAA
jgi:DNA-binding CsgD family transcriptional regulator